METEIPDEGAQGDHCVRAEGGEGPAGAKAETGSAAELRTSAPSSAAEPETQLANFVAAATRLGLCGLVFAAWLLFGGAILQALEQPSELEELSALQEDIESAKAGLGDELFASVDAAFSRFPHTGSLCSSWPIDTNASAWTFSGSTFFSLQLATSIGYGTQAPRTVAGKLFAVIFSIIGFCIWGYTNNLLSSIVEGVVVVVVRQKYKQMTGGRVLRFLSSNQAVLLVESVLVFAWLMLMAAYYQAEEGWEFSDSLYFSFVSTSTIGE